MYNICYLGRNNGSLTQYKPDLKEAKTLSGPDGKNVCPVSILWLSTYQFIVAFKDKDDQDSRPGGFNDILSRRLLTPCRSSFRLIQVAVKGYGAVNGKMS